MDLAERFMQKFLVFVCIEVEISQEACAKCVTTSDRASRFFQLPENGVYSFRNTLLEEWCVL